MMMRKRKTRTKTRILPGDDTRILSGDDTTAVARVVTPIPADVFQCVMQYRTRIVDNPWLSTHTMSAGARVPGEYPLMYIRVTARTLALALVAVVVLAVVVLPLRGIVRYRAS